MIFLILIDLLLLLSVSSSPLHNERRQIIDRVRKHLRQSDVTPRNLRTTLWLSNFNVIGLGYDLLSGSPVCYTSECRVNGFTRSIFKLNFTSSVSGSCTGELIPNNVDLQCLPTTSVEIDGEIIDTVEQLQKSISNKVQVSNGAKFKGVEFSYEFSKKTRHMIDNIVKKHQTSIFTSAKISLAKLSMFELKMELSDNFRYVLENMPCCEEDDPDIEEYVKDFIFDYFGLTYVTQIVLGGIAYQNIFINREAKSRLEKQDIDIKQQAKLMFDVSRGGSTETSVGTTDVNNDLKYKNFIKEIQLIESGNSGGDRQLMNLKEWSKTVSNNPVVTEFVLRDIFRLFNRRYFPSDQLINQKSNLIEKILEKYLSGLVYCYNDCGGNNTRGTCEPTGYFKFGICKCKPEWTGPDCSERVPKKILHGTLCGFDRSFMRVNCNGMRPWNGCPKGWSKHVWKTDLTVCYKDQTEVSNPMHGTLCGLHSYQYSPYPFVHDIACSTTANVQTNTCPLGYERHIAFDPQKMNAVCIVTDAKEHLPGTLCGMQVQGTIDGPSCNGSNPGLNQCPPEYSPTYTAFNNLRFMVCVKK